MPDDLTQLLRQHVDTLSHTPAAGFTGVRAKARRRSQHRAGAAALATAAVVVLGVVLGNAALSPKRDEPSHRAPTTTTVTAPAKAATLTGTHWKFTSISALGKTIALDDEQAYLSLPELGGWLMREQCQNISGGAELGQQVRLLTQTKGSGACQAQPLPTAVTEVLHSPLTYTLAGQTLTLSGATGSMSFRAESEPSSEAVTSRIWFLTRLEDASGVLDVTGEATLANGPWLEFSKGGWFASDCNIQQGGAAFAGSALDLTGGPGVDQGTTCNATSHFRVANAYLALAKEGRVTWTLAAGTLTLKGVSTTLTFSDAGPLSALAR